MAARPRRQDLAQVHVGKLGQHCQDLQLCNHSQAPALPAASHHWLVFRLKNFAVSTVEAACKCTLYVRNAYVRA